MTISSTMFNNLYVFSRTFIFALLSVGVFAQAADMGVPIQLKLRAPDLSYPTETGISLKVYILSSTGCILREEDFTNRDITEGSISLMLGSGILGADDPGLSLNSVYNNAVAKTGLTCIDANNVEVSTGQTYTPAATDGRILRVSTSDLASPIIANFNMKSSAYAIQAESVGGKIAADILTQNAATQLNQTNLEALLGDATKLTNLMNIANTGQAISAATATNATNATNAVNATNSQNSVSFTGSLLGDVTGVQSATVVTKLRGVNLSATAPTLGQVLTYDGAQYVPTTPAAAAVTSVNGQTGAVVLNASQIAGVVTSASALAGDVTGNVSATVVSNVGGKSAAAIATIVNDVNSATANATAGMLVRRDGSGNISANTISATNNSTKNIYLYEATNSNYVRLQAPGTFSNYTLTFPTTAGSAGQMLQTDGTGVLSWVAGGGVTSAGVISALGYTPADTNDARITGALSQTSFNAYVASANCNTAQTMYWNSVSSTFSCQNIAVSSSVVVAALGYTPADTNDARITGAVQTSAIPTCAGGEYLSYNGAAWVCAADVVGGAATSGAIIAALGYTPADNAALANYPTKANNLSDLTSATVARTNLGLGAAATLNIGTIAGTVAAGNDARITGAVQASAIPTCAGGEYLSYNGAAWVCAADVIGGAATSGAIITALGYTPADNAALANYPTKTNNLSDLASATVARTNLGLGAAATLNIGTIAGTVAAGNDARITGAVQASAIPTCAGGEYLSYNGAAWVCAADVIGGAATSGAIITALGYTPADNAALANYPTKTNNLSDLASATVARTNLGLGAAATLNIGTIAGTIAAGNDSRITGALQQTAFNASIANAACTTGETMYWNSVSSEFLCQTIVLTNADIVAALGFTPANNSASGTYAQKANNLSDLSNIVTARANLGLGGFATVSSLNLGSASATGTLAAARLPAFTGDVTSTVGTSALTLADSGVNAGTYATVTVDAKGRVTSGNALTDTNVTTALGYTPINRSLASAQMYLGNGSNIATAVAMSGDATIANTGAVTLKNTGTAGTYGASNTALTMTTDAQGRVTAVSSNPITINSSQVTNFASTVIATVLPGLVFTNSAVTAADSILIAIGKLQAQLNTLINPATTMVSATGVTTVNTTTDTLMSGMTITPTAGTYQVNFTTSVTHGTNGAVISMSIYVDGVEVTNSITQTIPRVAAGFNNVILTLNQTVLGEVTVNGSQAIEIRWNSSTGTASTASGRTMIINRVR